MKQLKKDLKAISKSLKQLTLRTEKIVKAVEKLEKDQVKPKSVKKAVKKPAVKKTAKKPTENIAAKGSVVGSVMRVIRASKKGVSVAQIMEQTGLKDGQVWPAISRAKKQGKVKIVKKGIYVKT
jgi:Asp-tRNA(Asn)/Glu-tRNA(Gln) amidotransferase B subunit